MAVDAGVRRGRLGVQQLELGLHLSEPQEGALNTQLALELLRHTQTMRHEEAQHGPLTAEQPHVQTGLRRQVHLPHNHTRFFVLPGPIKQSTFTMDFGKKIAATSGLSAALTWSVNACLSNSSTWLRFRTRLTTAFNLFHRN